MSAQKSVSKINLLPQKGFSSTTSGRILAWILSTFRIIVIVTEIIVMTAFLSRFWLDAQNTDLTEEISQKKTILTNLAEFDEEFKDVQHRLSQYENYMSQTWPYNAYLSTIRSYLPNDVILTSITFIGDSISIEGFSPSESSIEQLQINLAATDKFVNVRPTEIRSSLEEQGNLQFNIEALLKRGDQS